MSQYSNKPATHSMRPSKVLKRIREGGIASCLKVNSSDPRIVEIFAASGVDCIWLCSEHTPTNFADLENQVRAARVHDCDTVVRIKRGCYSDYIVGFEMDGTGLMVPHVMNLEDAQNVQSMTKFPPIGRRAVDGGNVDGLFCRIGITDYLEQANRERFVIYQIEDPEVVPDLERIVELPGVDMVLFGAGDYSVTIGCPGELWTNPEVCKLRERIAKVARNAGKAAGIVAGPGKFREAVDMGYNFICAGADVVTLNQFSDSVMAEFAKL